MGFGAKLRGWWTRTSEKAASDYRTDPNINRVKGWVEPVSKRLPSATVEYLLEKLPILQWLPNYHPKWLIQDVIGGLTIGVMFIPQGLAYAQIATIPVEHGLYSCWIPAALYCFLGTSKELSSGPTSILGLLTAEVVHDLSSEGYGAAAISSAICFMVGCFTLALGLLKLGFLLDFVSAPVLSGWISAVALVILLGQVKNLIGMSDVPSEVAGLINRILGNLHEIKPKTLGMGLGTIVILLALEHVGKRWGKKNMGIKILATSRAVVALVLFTLISFLVNRNETKETYHWKVAQVDTDGLWRPRAHDTTLLSKVIGRSFAPLIAMAVEHLGVGKAFGLRNNYQIDKSQELVFLGLENLCASFFGAMTTGAAMSRTAVASEAGVHTPLYQLVTASFIILVLYELSPALYWIPQATLAAIIIMAVVHLISPPSLFYRYYRMSFIDFFASMLGFWVTLFTSTEIGLATAVGFNIVVTLLRMAFPRWIGLSSTTAEQEDWQLPKPMPDIKALDIPPEAYYVRFTDALLFPNAEKLKAAIVEAVKVQYEPTHAVVDLKSPNRSWNVSDMKRIPKIRRRKGIIPISADVTTLSHVVLDFGMVTYMDVTGVISLVELKTELRRYIGKELQFRYVGVNSVVYERFRRSDILPFSRHGEPRVEGHDVIYTSLETALFHRDGDSRSETATDEKAVLEV